MGYNLAKNFGRRSIWRFPKRKLPIIRTVAVRWEPWGRLKFSSARANSSTGLSFLFLLRLFSLGSVSACDQSLYLCHPYLTHQCRRRNSLLAVTDSGHYHAASPLRRRCVSTAAVCRPMTVMRMPRAASYQRRWIMHEVSICDRRATISRGFAFSGQGQDSAVA